ncbi:MAG TPA: hypothetical protein VMZ33_05315, partial [Candidatus Limnocylindrales bacterium]|nr:hypothetical protein [Candidatus Limnocylindrales bacterium]
WLEDGLALVRRASDREAEAWMAWQLSDYWEFRGDFVLAIEYCRLSVELAEQHGDVATGAARRVGLAWLEAHLGRWPATNGDGADDATVAPGEDQYLAWGTAWRAVLAWRDRPAAGLELIRGGLGGMSTEARAPALWGARMAYRLGDEDVIRMGRSNTGGGRTVAALVDAWMAAFLDDVASAPHGLARVVAEADRLGYRNFAQMARDDLALAVARSGRDASVEVRNAVEFARGLGIQPLLGPLPETRWLTAGPDDGGKVAVDAAAD